MRIKADHEKLAIAFASLENNDSFQEINAILKRGGQAHDMVSTMAMYPPLLEAMETLGNAVYPGGSLFQGNSRNSSSCNHRSTTVVSFAQTVT